MRLPSPAFFTALSLAASPALAQGVSIRGVKDGELRAKIEAALPASPNPPETLFDARRRAENAAESALNALYAEGYYGAAVSPAAVETPKPQAIIEVETGPLFRFKRPAFVFEPDFSSNEAIIGAVSKAARLPEGGPATGIAVIGAEAAGLEALRKAGYAEAEIGERNAIADHADNTLAITFRYRPGPKIILGDLKVEGAAVTNPAYLESLRAWKPGDVYSPEAFNALSRRAADTGAFDAAAPSLEPAASGHETLSPAANAAERRDVLLTVKERKRRTLTLGGSYSTSEGFGLEGSHIWRNLRGKGEQVTVAATLAQLERALTAEIAYPHWRKPDHTLKLGAGISQSETDAYDQTELKFSAGVDTDRTLRFGLGYGAILDVARVKDATGESDLYVGGLYGSVRIDQSNDLLDPSKGYRAELRLEPTGVLGDQTVGFLKATATVSGYQKLDRKGRTVAAARFRYGAIAGAPLTGVPADWRFYAGGGGSVRGFEYQRLSPSAAEVTRTASSSFTAFGGRSVVEASFEMRFRITQTWGAAAFIDAGAASANSTPDFSAVRAGAGIGLRYYTDFGPLRFDLATPLDRKAGDSALQFYVSIGQSF